MHKAMGLLVWALSATAAAAGQSPAPEMAAADGTVTFDVKSWGKNVAHWQLHTDGSGELWRFAKGADFWSYDVQKFHFVVRSDFLPQLRASLDALRKIAAHPPACGERSTDLPYGSLVWQGAETTKLSFDFGCSESKTIEVLKNISAVDDEIENQATIDPGAFETAHFGPPKS